MAGSSAGQPRPRSIRCSWVGFSWRVAITPGSPRRAPAKMKCSPMTVFPDPVGPATSVEAPGQKPSASIASRASRPLEIRWSPSRYSPGGGNVGQPGEQVQALAAQAIGVPAGPEATAPQLPDLQEPHLALAAAYGGQVDDRISDGELRQERDLRCVVFADPQGGGGKGGQQPGELVQEPPEFGVVSGEGAQGLEAVDHDEPRAALLERQRDLFDDPGQAVRADRLAQVLVEHGRADRGGARRNPASARTGRSFPAARTPWRNTPRGGPDGRREMRTAARRSFYRSRAGP